MVGKLYIKFIRLKDETRKRRITGHGYILANLGSHSADAGCNQANTVGAGCVIGNNGVLKVRSLTISEIPIPLGWVSGAQVIEGNGKLIGLCQEQRSGCGTGNCNISAELLTGTADPGSGQTNLISAGFLEGNYRVLLGGSLAVSEIPEPLARLVGA